MSVESNSIGIAQLIKELGVVPDKDSGVYPHQSFALILAGEGTVEVQGNAADHTVLIIERPTAEGDTGWACSFLPRFSLGWTPVQLYVVQHEKQGLTKLVPLGNAAHDLKKGSYSSVRSRELASWADLWAQHLRCHMGRCQFHSHKEGTVSFGLEFLLFPLHTHI